MVNELDICGTGMVVKISTVSEQPASDKPTLTQYVVVLSWLTHIEFVVSPVLHSIDLLWPELLNSGILKEILSPTQTTFELAVMRASLT